MADSMGASDFKARCLAVLDEVHARGITVVVTKHGKPVAKVTPVADAPRSLCGSWKDLARIEGDIVHCDFSDEFEALS